MSEDALRREIAELRRMISQRPLIGGGGGTNSWKAYDIVRGYKFYDDGTLDIYGASPATVATACAGEASMAVAINDGLAVAEEVLTGALVWVSCALTDDSAITRSGLNMPLPVGSRVWARTAYLLDTHQVYLIEHA